MKRKPSSLDSVASAGKKLFEYRQRLGNHICPVCESGLAHMTEENESKHIMACESQTCSTCGSSLVDSSKASCECGKYTW